MLTRDALAELRDSLREHTVLSVYLDGRVTDPAARLTWRSTLATKLTALRERLADDAPEERRDFSRCLALLERQIAAIHGALSAPGFVAFVTADRVALAELLPVVMPNVARWERGPWISPYLRALKELRPVVLTVVDRRSARLYRYAQGTLSPLGHFHAHVQIDQPTHMGNTSRPLFHTGTRGTTTADVVDRARRHGTQRMLRELVDHIMTVAAADEWIVIGGTSVSAELLSMLPPATGQRAGVVTGLSAGTAAAPLRAAAREQARRLRQRLDRELVETAIAHAAEGGRGSVGEEASRAALEMNDVHMLLISARFMNDRPDVAEMLARLALDGGAAIEVVSPPAADRLDRAGGVAGILRYIVPGTAAEPMTGALA